MLELEQVVKHYRGAGEEVRAIDGVSLTVSPGEMLALHGPSGSGKTTLLKLAATLLAPERGTVRFDGVDLASFSEDDASDYLLRDVGFVYQNFRLMPRVSALENASIKLLLGGVGRREARAQALTWLERLGLGDRTERTPEQLSGGERQRVAIARALSGDPPLILADEPTGNLDSARSREIVALLGEIAHERSAGVLLVTHDTEAATARRSQPHAARRRAARCGGGARMSRAEPLKTRALLRPYALLYLYRRRLRVNAAQELFAGIGIAIAVALVFAATVAESSIAGSSAEVVHAVAGPASLQLRARGGAGFDERLLERVQHLPGVKQAAPLLEQSATVRAANGRHTTIDLAGTDTSLAVLDGLGETLPLAALTPGTIGLSEASADALGIPTARRGPAGGGGSTGGGDSTGAGYVTLQMRGRATRLRVSAVLGPEAVGALSRALVAVMPLGRMQQLSGLPGQITRIFVETQPGAKGRCARSCERSPGGRLTVAPADQDVTLLREALGPSRLASGLFAAIGALLGFLLAFNAMLLTVPERRQAIADLRLAGTRRVGIVQMVLFQALCLGIAASLVGLLAGYLLSVGVFHQSSAYLAEAFTLGSNTVIGLRPLLLAFVGGVLATCLASAVVLADLRRGRARDAVYQQDGVPGDALRPAVRRRLLAGSVGLLAAATCCTRWRQRPRSRRSRFWRSGPCSRCRWCWAACWR